MTAPGTEGFAMRLDPCFSPGWLRHRPGRIPRALHAALCAAALGACQSAPAAPVTQHAPPAAAAPHPGGSPASEVGTLLDDTLDQLLAEEPGWGRGLGLHQYDGRVPAYSPDALRGRIGRLRVAHQALAGLPTAQLGANVALDVALLRSAVESRLFELEDWNQWRKNPLFYQGLFSVNDYLDRDYAPLPERARQLVTHEEAALREIGHVLGNLAPPLPRPIVETAIKVYAGYAEYLRTDVVRLVGAVGDADLQRRFKLANTALADQAEAISTQLEKVELARSDGGFALGTERYLKFVRIQEGFTPTLTEFSKMAEADLQANKAAYEKLVRSVRQSRPTPAQLLPEATRMTEAARLFLTRNQLVTVPDERPPSVRETPPFMRWNQAFLLAPGPFERPGLEAFYYITLPDPNWPAYKQHDYLMTRGTLVSTTVHETYPGHFLQGAWTRLAPTRIQKSTTSYSFSEGWAHYTEQLMTEAGFASDHPETRLGQLSDALLRNCRFVASIGLHTGGMTLEQAEKRFVRDCHQDLASAHEQAVRGTFDPGYFAYTLGKLQILALRDEAKKRLGARFSLKRFHDALLSHGTSPVPLIQDRVLAELETGASPAAQASP